MKIPVSSKIFDKQLAIYFSFDTDTFSPVNYDLNLQANKLIDRTKVDRDSKGKRTKEINSSNSGKV